MTGIVASVGKRNSSKFDFVLGAARSVIDIARKRMPVGRGGQQVSGIRRNRTSEPLVSHKITVRANGKLTILE